MNFEKRDLVSMFFLTIITFGIYKLYWLVKTKEELNKAGADIPTAWLLVIPFANFYFLWRWAEAFAEKVKKDNNSVIYFVILIFLPFISMLILQNYINNKK
jgi:hypothetical protein